MSKFIEKLDKVFTTFVEGFTFVGFIAMVLLVFINVCGRYLLGKGIVQSEEMARILFVWLTYLGTVLCFKSGSHVTVDILISFLHGVPRKVVDLIANLLLTGILVIATYYSCNLITVNLHTTMAMTKLPMWLVEGIIPVSMAIMLVINVYNMFVIIRKKYD